MPHKGASTQQHNQQVLAKPRHSPSDRDQQARQKLQQKAKIRSRAYIQLGEDTLKTVHRTFQPGVPVILHLPTLTDGSLSSKETTTPTLFVIQESLNCLETTDYFFTNIEPKLIIVEHPPAHHSTSTSHQPLNGDKVSQQTPPAARGNPDSSVYAYQQASTSPESYRHKNYITHQSTGCIQSLCVCSHGRKEDTQDQHTE